MFIIINSTILIIKLVFVYGHVYYHLFGLVFIISLFKNLKFKTNNLNNKGSIILFKENMFISFNNN